MRQIRVLLVHRESDIYRRLTGWWSYPVDDFVWTALKIKPEWFEVDLQYAPNFDLVVLDDWVFGQFKNKHVPLAYVTVDSARSDVQLSRNRNQAAQADLILVDSDRLDRFAGMDKPVRRFAYAVNEQLFFPREKVYDVAFLCWPTEARRIVAAQCAEICKRRGWSFVSGTFEWNDYARFLSSAKIVVHKPHVENARSWRVFDVMAARGALLTMPLPTVDGDGIAAGMHYLEYHNPSELEQQLSYLMEDEHWRQFAENGYEHVMQHHTWRTRSAQLRAMLDEVFKW